MPTITEDFVSFETAKLLKEKNCPDFGYSCICDSEGNKAQTQSIIMKWLREVHKISIEITSTGYLIDNNVEWECDIKAGHRLYFKHITNEKSFESCAEAAIRYCLENLI